jgi:hypothetical protein
MDLPSFLSIILLCIKNKNMIRKSFLCILVVLSSYSFSQENKNKFVANATIQLTSGSSGPVNMGGVYLGYFFTNSLSFGITGYQSQDRSLYRDETVWQTYSKEEVSLANFSGAFIRYNHSFKNKFGVFVSLNPGYRWNKLTITETTNSFGTEAVSKRFTKGNGLSVGLHPGIIYFVNKQFSAEVTLGHISYITNFSKESESVYIQKDAVFETSFFTSGLNLGVSFYFGCKKDNK